MVCLGLKQGVAGWKAQTNPLNYGGTPYLALSLWEYILQDFDWLHKLILRLLTSN